MTKAQLRAALKATDGDDNQDVQIYMSHPALGDGYAYFDLAKVTTVGPLEHGATGTVLEIGDFRSGGS